MAEPVLTRAFRSQLSGVVGYPALLVLIVTGVWMGLLARPYHMARNATQEPDAVLNERLRQTRPLTAIWVGTLGLLVLLFLMVFRPF